MKSSLERVIYSLVLSLTFVGCTGIQPTISPRLPSLIIFPATPTRIATPTSTPTLARQNTPTRTLPSVLPTLDLTPFNVIMIATAPPFAPIQPKKITSGSDSWSGAQGNKGWFYLEDRDGNLSEWSNMRWDPALRFRFCEGGCWRSNREAEYVRLDKSGGHPGERNNVAKQWISSISRQIRVEVTAYMVEAGGNGVVLRLIRNRNVLRELTLDGDQTRARAASFSISFSVAPRDEIKLALGSKGNAVLDHTAFDMTILDLE